MKLQCLIDAMTDRSVIGVRAGVYFYHGGFVDARERREIMDEFGIKIAPRPKPREPKAA